MNARFVVWKRTLAAALILGFTLLAAGCITTYYETARTMPNQRATKHVQGWRSHNNAQHVLPVVEAPSPGS